MTVESGIIPEPKGLREDRLLHHAIAINIRGNSYRLKDKLKDKLKGLFGR